MSQQFVEIVNRGTYTNVRKATMYVDRGLAEALLYGLNRLPLKIRMLENAEILVVRASISAERREANLDDGIERRWVNRNLSKQLRPISEVGTTRHVGKVRDLLTRRHGRNDPGRSVLKVENA